MANGIFWRRASCARFVDVFGVEADWTDSGHFDPDAHEILFYRRAIAFHKPYLYLQNADFNLWTNEMTRKYMNMCLLYGHWPGFFSDNAADDRYFDQPLWYNRDRDLFKKYIPLFQRITARGWEPYTAATVSVPENHAVYVQRYGTPSTEANTVYVAVRVEGGSAAVKGTVELESELDVVKAGGTMKAVEQVSGTEVSVSEMRFEYTFEMDETYLFEVDLGKEVSGSGRNSVFCVFAVLAIAFLALF